jgi:hypothetical protein
VAGEPTDWGVLQALGTAGLLCLTVIRFGTAARFAIGVVLLAAYQAMLNAFALPTGLFAFPREWFCWMSVTLLSERRS